MKIVRGFLRVEPGNMDAFSARMDSLLAADPRELTEFISDGILSLAARAEGQDDPVGWALDVVREIAEGEDGGDALRRPPQVAAGVREPLGARLRRAGRRVARAHGPGGTVGVTERILIIVTCAGCGAPKFEKDPCPECGGRENAAGTTRTLKAKPR